MIPIVFLRHEGFFKVFESRSKNGYPIKFYDISKSLYEDFENNKAKKESWKKLKGRTRQDFQNWVHDFGYDFEEYLRKNAKFDEYGWITKINFTPFKDELDLGPGKKIKSSLASFFMSQILFRGEYISLGRLEEQKRQKKKLETEIKNQKELIALKQIQEQKIQNERLVDSQREDLKIVYESLKNEDLEILESFSFYEDFMKSYNFLKRMGKKEEALFIGSVLLFKKHAKELEKSKFESLKNLGGALMKSL